MKITLTKSYPGKLILIIFYNLIWKKVCFYNKRSKMNDLKCSNDLKLSYIKKLSLLI